MCGRYALYGPQSRLREQFGTAPVPDWPDRYNIAPSQIAPVVVAGEGGARQIVQAKWGLLPSWVKEPGERAQPINARVETAAEKPMFRHAFGKRRVLVPASGFYEWVVTADHKQPWFIRPRGDDFFALGGLLEHWEGPDGTVLSYAVLTTAANELMAPIHERMPVIIQPENYAAWVDPEVTEAGLVRELAGTFPPARMQAFPVGRAVGNPRNEGPGLVEPLAQGELAQGSRLPVSASQQRRPRRAKD